MEGGGGGVGIEGKVSGEWVRGVGEGSGGVGML